MFDTRGKTEISKSQGQGKIWAKNCGRTGLAPDGSPINLFGHDGIRRHEVHGENRISCILEKVEELAKSWLSLSRQGGHQEGKTSRH
jgi:hypothetical protein